MQRKRVRLILNRMYLKNLIFSCHPLRKGKTLDYEILGRGNIKDAKSAAF